MANGYIILKDRSCFSTRWTGYDEIVRIAARESALIEGGLALAEYLFGIVPNKYLPEDDNQWGTGFVNAETGETYIGKELDLRGLTKINQQLFWQALEAGYKKLINEGESYSFLNPVRLKELLDRRKLAENEANPLDHSDWNVLADSKVERIGPGWE